MPKRLPRIPDDADDDRPAFGLRDDDYDDHLRKHALSDEERDDISAGYSRARHQIRKIEKYSKDPADWLADTCMTQTEVALRLGRSLITSGAAQAKVVITLAGDELTNREMPRFPVDRFLTERLGFTRQGLRTRSWEGVYIMKDRSHSLVLLDRDRFEGHLTTRLSGRRRLVAFVTRGHTTTTRSAGEHKWLRGAIGRAATWDARARDVLAVCAPRSAQFSKIARTFREREGVKRLRLHVLIIDRQTGDVTGLEDLQTGS
jgi:hypothetical protein